jgi:hypothetical protein
MHRYQPKLYIQPIPNDCREAFSNCSEWWKTFCWKSSSAAASFTFPETQFITVTAYQNQQVNQLGLYIFYVFFKLCVKLTVSFFYLHVISIIN